MYYNLHIVITCLSKVHLYNTHFERAAGRVIADSCREVAGFGSVATVAVVTDSPVINRGLSWCWSCDCVTSQARVRARDCACTCMLSRDLYPLKYDNAANHQAVRSLVYKDLVSYITTVKSE